MDLSQLVVKKTSGQLPSEFLIVCSTIMSMMYVCAFYLFLFSKPVVKINISVTLC